MLHNVQYLHPTLKIIKGEMGIICDMHVGDKKYINSFSKKPQGKRPLGRLG
jgi:hypothetical protein